MPAQDPSASAQDNTLQAPDAAQACSTEVPPSAEIVVSDFEEATGTVGASEDGNSAALEDFISKITMNIPPPLMDKPPRRR